MGNEMTLKPRVNWPAVTDSVMWAAKQCNLRFIKSRHIIEMLDQHPRQRCKDLTNIPEKSLKTRVNTVLLRDFPRYGDGSNNGAVYICEWVEA